LHLRRSLERGRWRGILTGLATGDHFFCHQTTVDDDDGEAEPGRKARLCAGAIEWQARRGIVATCVELCERLDSLARKGKL
jgi:hypothetical protein